MAALKNKLRRAVVYTMIAANAGNASPAWLPRHERLGETMAETTVKGVEKKDEDARLKKGAKMLYDTYKKLYPKVDEKQYYMYLTAFGKKLNIYNVEAFNTSIGDVRNIGNGQMTFMAIKELERQRLEKKEAESSGKSFVQMQKEKETRRAETAGQRAKKREAVKEEVSKVITGGEITPETKPAKVTAPAVIAGKGIFGQTQGVFQTEQNVLKGSDGNAMLDSRGAVQYAYPSNMASLQSLGVVDYSALKEATGNDFIDQLRKSEAKGGTVEERGQRSFETTARMIGAIVLYNSFAFADKAGTVKKNQLKDYCGDDGYAENLGRVLSAKPLRNQGQFIGEVTSFIGAYVKNGKLTEINGEGKDEKGKSNVGMYVYSIAAIGSAYTQRVIGETFESQMSYLQERKKAAETQKAGLEGQVKEEAKRPAAAQRAKKLAGEDAETQLKKADAEIQSITDMTDSISSYSWYYKKPMTVSELYKRHRDEDRKRLTSLNDYVGGLNIPQRIKRPFQDALENEKTQMVLLQMAIEEANPEGRMTLAELREKGNIWRNYKTLVTHKLKEIATYKLNKGQRLIYVMLNNRYGDLVDAIEAKLGPEETARFIVDLADPSQAKKQGMSYDDYIRATLKDKWINGGISPVKDAKGSILKDPRGNVIKRGRSCLDDYRSGFNSSYGQKSGSLDSQRFPDKLVASLVIDHRITQAELDFLIANRGDMKPEEALNAFNAKLNDAKKNFNEKSYSTVKRMVDEAQGLIGFDKAYYEEFRDIILVRLALIDMTNRATQRTSSLTLDGIIEGNLSGVRAFGAKTAALVAKVDEIAPLEKMPDNITGDAKGVLLQRARTQRINAYIELFNNEFFTLNDERYTKITVQRLNDFKLRLDTWEEVLKTMKEDDPYHIAKDTVLRAGCIRTLESMKQRLDAIMKEVGDKGIDLSEIKDPGDRFLLDLVINGRVIIAGINGFRYYDNVATVDRQGFIPVIFYFLNNIQLNAEENRSYLDHVLKMPEGNGIDVWEAPETIAQQLETERSNRIENMRSEGWKTIMGSSDKATEMYRMLGFQQAYDYYSSYLKKNKDSTYDYSDASALDAELERIFGKDMLDNVNLSVKFAMNMYTPNRNVSKYDLDRLSTRFKMVLASNLVLEAPYYDLSNTAKQGSKSIPVSVTKKDGAKESVNIQYHDNMVQRWIEGYRSARIGGISVDKDMIEGFIGSIAQCKWAATLKPGQYSITFENDLHELRSFDVTVSKVGGDMKGAAANIKIEPMSTLEDLLKTPGGFRAYEGDRIVMRNKADNSVALATKSNFGVLMVASAKVGGRGFENAVNQVSLMNDNLVPDGRLEEGTQPASFWTGLYFAVTKKEAMSFISNRQMALYDIAATFRPIRDIRPEVPVKVTKVLGKETLDFAALIGAPSDAGISTTWVDAGGAVHNWFSEMAEGKLTIDENGNLSAQIMSRATGTQLMLGELKTELDRLGYTDGTPQRAIILQHLFGTGPYNDNMVIEVVATQQGNRIFIVTKGAQNMAQAEIGIEIDRQTISEMRYGYLTDRLRLFIATQTQLKLGNEIINVRVELGKTAADFQSMKRFKDIKTAIVNAYLSSNIFGAGWSTVLSESGNAVTVQPYLVAYLEHMMPNDLQRIIETGGGVSGILETANAEFGATPQLTGITVGQGGDWMVTPSLNLYQRWFTGRHFDLYQSASVHYRFPTAGLVDRVSKGHLGGTWGGGGNLGFDYIIDRNWRMGLGGGYEYAPISIQAPVSVFSSSASISFRNRLSLEVMANYQLDKDWGTENLPVLGRGVVAGKAALVYNIGRLDFTPKEKGTAAKKGGKK
jgi:hypothetical protein